MGSTVAEVKKQAPRLVFEFITVVEGRALLGITRCVSKSLTSLFCVLQHVSIIT